MELTGKVLKDFWVWYLNSEQRKEYKTQSLIGGETMAKCRFMGLSFSERFGVYQDYFDNFGVRVDIIEVSEVTMSGTKLHGYRYYFNGFKQNKTICKTRSEARLFAIQDAIELRNEVLHESE